MEVLNKVFAALLLFIARLNGVPIIGPFLALLRSRKFIIAVLTLTVNMFIADNADYEGIRELLMLLVTAIGGLSFFSVAAIDSAKKQNGLVAQGKADVLPVFDPLVELLRSRKFLLAVATIVVNMLIAQSPELEGMREILMTLVTAGLGMLIAAILREDVAEAQAGIISPAALGNIRRAGNPTLERTA